MTQDALRVLVADDEPSIRFVLRETLEEQGCEVIDVEDGDAALAALEDGGLTLAFLDIRMPGATGLELLDRVRALGVDTAIVIITAQNTYENAVEAMKRGALDYLVKPFALDEVKALVAKVLRTRALEREVQPAILDEPVNLVEQRGHLLDLIDHDLLARRRCRGLDLLPQQLGSSQVAPKLLGLEQIDPTAVAVGLPQQCALAGLARPPEKEGLGPGGREEQVSCEHGVHFIRIV